MSTINAVLSSGVLTVTVADTNLQSHDWVGFYAQGTTPGVDRLFGWLYLNANKVPPGSPIANATLSPFFIALPAGIYDVYLFANDTVTVLAQTTLTVSSDFGMLPIPATRWADDQELILGTFGPGVSGGVIGPWNPAGPRTGVVIDVETGAVTGGSRDAVTPQSLASAIAAAKYGDDIVCAAQSTKSGGYVTNLRLPLDSGTTGGNANKVVDGSTPKLPWRPSEPSYIRIMSADWADVPLRRVGPGDSAHLFLLKAANSNQPHAGVPSSTISFEVLTTTNPLTDQTRQHHYWFDGMQLEHEDAPTGQVVLVNMHEYNGTMPNHIVFSRTWGRGNPTGAAGATSPQRGFQGTCDQFGLFHSTIDGINTNAQAECSALYIIQDMNSGLLCYNSYMQAATQCVMHGGGGNDGQIGPTDLVYERCVFGWDPKWQVDTVVPNVTATITSGTQVTLSGDMAFDFDREWFFLPSDSSRPPARVNGWNGHSLITITPAYPNQGPVAFGLLTGGMIDSGAAERSAGVTVDITGVGAKTVTRSSGKFGMRVTVGRYFCILNAQNPARFLITNVSTDRSQLTLSATDTNGNAGPTNANGIVNWMVGTWDRQPWVGTLKNLWETKTGRRVSLIDCIFQDYWGSFSGPGSPAQTYAIAFKSNTFYTYSTDLILRGCLFQRTTSIYQDVPPFNGDYAANGPGLVEDNLFLVGNLFPNGATPYASSYTSQGMTWRHNTFITESDVSLAYPNQPGVLFPNQTGSVAYAWRDNLLAMGAGQIYENLNPGHVVSGSDDSELASLGILLANIDRNAIFGGDAASHVRANGYLRSTSLAGTRYGNAAITSRNGIGFVNPTGREDGDYTLQPLYTTDVGACTVSGDGLTVSIASGTFAGPTSQFIQKGTPFRASVDGVDKLTSVSAVTNSTTLTLATPYPGTRLAGLTGVFTFQGSASDGLDPGVRNLADRMITWSEVAAGVLGAAPPPPPPPAPFPPLTSLLLPASLAPVATAAPVVH